MPLFAFGILFTTKHTKSTKGYRTKRLMPSLVDSSTRRAALRKVARWERAEPRTRRAETLPGWGAARPLSDRMLDAGITLSCSHAGRAAVKRGVSGAPGDVPGAEKAAICASL